ncbi:MAG: hypothetical protein U0746_07270 [Gemmataceae bacterium]
MRIITFAACLAATLVTSIRAQELPDLERALVRAAPDIIRHFKAKKYANVGVLKFAVSKDGKALADNVGTLNMSLANRLEIALIVENDARQPIGIIRNASAVAARTRGANHRTADGRLALFSAKYPLAWGKHEVTPDAFVTGIAAVSKDLKTITLGFVCFDKATNTLTPIGKDVVAKNRPDELAEIGESFSLRGIGEASESSLKTSRQAAQAFDAAVGVQNGAAKHPLQDNPLVSLTIQYDGRPVPIEFRDGKAFVAEPREGQVVTLVLGKNATRERYAVVLKVNGENTLERQKLPDAQCRMWVFDPGTGPYEIRGFQKAGHTAEQFRVASAVETTERALNYGADVGTITLTVFRELAGRPQPAPIDDESADAATVAKAQLPTNPPESFAALKASLEADGSRSLIVEGAEIKSQVQVVRFTPDPTPVTTATVVYYKPR